MRGGVRPCVCKSGFRGVGLPHAFRFRVTNCCGVGFQDITNDIAHNYAGMNGIRNRNTAISRFVVVRLG